MVKLGGQEAVKKSISRIWREFNRANFCSESAINDVCDVGIHLRSLAKFAKPIFSQLPVPEFPQVSKFRPQVSWRIPSHPPPFLVSRHIHSFECAAAVVGNVYTISGSYS